MKLNVHEKYLIFFIFFFGILLRYINHSYDDLWYDEIISFWVANPEFSLKETLFQNKLIEVNVATYNIMLKFFFTLFGYSVENGRLFSVIFSSFSIITVGYLCKMITKDKSYLLATFLISFNIFLISYSQEVRVYSILFFFSSLTLIFFIKILNENKSIFLLLGFALSSIVLMLLHPFTLIIFISFILYLSLIFFKFKKFHYHLTLVIFFTIIFAMLIYFQNFILTTDNEVEYFWMANPDLGFYSNYYFSSYFGSRLLGLIFLVTLFFLILKNYKKILGLNYISLLLIIIFLSYFLPIIFGYIFKPILVSRYIIFVLIPIILVISILTNQLASKKKFYLILFLTIITVGNHFTEQTFKQFFQERIVTKPEYSKAVKYINDSNNKFYFFKVSKMKNEQATINAINNYIKHINNKNNLNVEFVSLKKNNDIKIIWHICLQDINEKNCPIDNIKKDFNILKIKNFNNIELKLIEFK